MNVQSFVGPSNTLAASFADAEETINFMIESTQPGIAKAPKYLPATACVQPVLQGPSGPIRGNGCFQQDGRAFAVGGARFFEVFYSSGVWSYTDYGAVNNDSLPVSWASNGTAGNQIMLVSGGLGYIFNTLTNTLVQITDPFFPADVIQCEFMDGYFLVLIRNSRRFQISNLEDGLVWDALDVAEISEASDNIVSMIRNHREIAFLGTLTGEVWYDNGDPLFPFAPIQGVFIENGSAAAFSCCRADNAIFWIDQDERGNGIVRKLDGYTPARASTYAMELAIARSAELSETIAFAQQEVGHLFIWFLIPDLDWHLVYDVAENAWHKRGIWNTTTCEYEPYVANSHMFAFGKHIVGDRSTEWLYELSREFYADQVISS